MQFILSYPYWYLLLCTLPAIGITYLLYRNKKHHYSSPSIFYLLFTLRAIALSLVAILLLNPLLRFKTTQEKKPLLVLLQDNSRSIKEAFRKTDSVKYQNDINTLINNLQKQYQVKTYSFDKSLHDSIQFRFDGNTTNISDHLETILSTHENESLAAIILATDGIYNEGSSPLNLSYPFQGSIYTIGLGDTSIRRDAVVNRANANKLVYLNDQFAIKVDISALACNNENLNIQVFHHNTGRTIHTQSIKVNNTSFFKSLEFITTANISGIQHYSVSITPIIGEQNTSNNKLDLYVEVLENKDKILILAHAPHPDIFAIKEALSKNKNYQVDVSLAKDFKGNIGNYSLFILHNLPSASFALSDLLSQAEKAGLSRWYFIGHQSSIATLNSAQKAIQITSRATITQDATAVVNKDFNYFTLTPQFQLSNYPPLSSPFGEYSAGPNTQVLMQQRIGSVQTNAPLWLLQNQSGARTAIVCGEGIWRWRLYNYYQKKSYDEVDDFLQKTAQFLAVKNDRRPLRITLPKSVFSENEVVLMDAELYNENLEPVNNSDIQINLVNENKETSVFSMNKEQNSYHLTLGNLAAGSYSYVARAVLNGREIKSSGEFQVQDEDVELLNLHADIGMLNELANIHEGKFVYPSAISSLLPHIQQNPRIKPVLQEDISTKLLIHWKSIFALIIALLAVEWYIRKRSGDY